MSARERAGGGLSLARMIAIGSGDLGLNIYWGCTSVFLLFFYTETLGLSPAAGGAIYMVALIWDAAIDPVIGIVAERTRTRWGHYRPYLLFGAAPLAIAFVLVFALPTLDAGLRIALATAALLLFRTIYAMVAIPYATLFARVTNDSGERATMAGIRMAFAFAGGIAIAAITLPLTRWLGGWTVLATIYAAIACLFLWTAAAAVGAQDGHAAEAKPPPRIGQALRAMATNQALLIVLGIVLITSFSGTFFSKTVLYFFKYVRHDPDFGGTALAVCAGLAALSAPFWAKLARMYDKRTTMLAGLMCNVIGMALWPMARDAGYPLLFLALALSAIGTSATYVCFWAMLPDTIEYGEWHSGVRTEAVMFGTVIFVQKAALGLGAGALGVSLGLIGLVPNIEQSSEILDRLVLLMTLVPLGGAIAMFALAWFYPIDAVTHRRLLDAIADRNAGPILR